MLSLLFLLPVFCACGNSSSESPALPDSSAERPASEPLPETEPAAEPERPESDEAAVYRTVYTPPEDGSYTICGVPVSDYTILMYWPGEDIAWIKKLLRAQSESVFGEALPIQVLKTEKQLEQTRYEHEILIGNLFEREDLPSYAGKNAYGVTPSGTVYFQTPSRSLVPYMWSMFLEEFCGVPLETAVRSPGCRLSACSRTTPDLDLSRLQSEGYVPVFEDLFEGEEPNPEFWENRLPGVRRGGFNSAETVRVEDGKLIIRGEYLESGEFGPGWYGGAIALRQKYCRGYFEATIRASEYRGSNDFWSAFWIQGPDPYSGAASQGGIGPGGAELDIMENWGADNVTCTVWVSGELEEENTLTSAGARVKDIGKDYSGEYHTFSLIWDESFYRFYVDGTLIARNAHAFGTSSAEETVIFSLELPDHLSIDSSTVREMYVDSIRIWQKP